MLYQVLYYSVKYIKAPMTLIYSTSWPKISSFSSHGQNVSSSCLVIRLPLGNSVDKPYPCKNILKTSQPDGQIFHFSNVRFVVQGKI